MKRAKSVDEYIADAGSWKSELKRLREILQSTELEEDVKWGGPCYTYNGKNVVGMTGFKSYFGLWFHQGALLKDQKNVLMNAQEGRTKALQKVVPKVPVANLVVFTGSVQFTSPLEKNVVHVRDLNSYIAKFVFGPCKIKDWDAVWMTVKAAALTDDESRKDLSAQLSFS
jgi:hypothetical protein